MRSLSLQIPESRLELLGLAPRLFHRFRLGPELVASAGTAEFLKNHGLEVGRVLKIHEGRPHVVRPLQSLGRA